MISRRPGDGIIEGFYGRPWTTSERVSFVGHLGRAGLDTFIVAPKNDPLGFARPRHHARDFRAIEAIARAAGDASVRLYVSTCLENVESLVDAGVRGVVISLDDTWTTFAPGLATHARGAAHGAMARTALERARRRSADADALLVPAIYHRRAEDLGRGGLAYLRGIAASAPDVPVAWTGPAIFSRSVTAGDAARLQRATGLRLWLWNNAVTNDWLPLATGELVGARPWQKLCFGSIDNMSPGVEREVGGVLVNAAREPELSKVSALCLAAWLRDPLHYAAGPAVERSIREVAGDDAELVALAHDLTQKHPLSAPARFESRAVADAVGDFLAGRAPVSELVEKLEELVDAARRAGATNASDALRECAPTLDRASWLASAALTSIALGADAGRDRARARSLGAELDAHLRRARATRWQVGLESLQQLLSRSRSR